MSSFAVLFGVIGVMVALLVLAAVWDAVAELVYRVRRRWRPPQPSRWADRRNRRPR